MIVNIFKIIKYSMNREREIALFVILPFLKDPELCIYFMNILWECETFYLNLHRQKSIYRGDIKLLYYGFIKTALFETERLDDDDIINPGYSIYNIHPVLQCRNIIDWDCRPPIVREKYHDTLDTRGINILNRLRKNNDKMIIYLLIKKYKQYMKNNRRKISVWYDCEHNEFINI